MRELPFHMFPLELLISTVLYEVYSISHLMMSEIFKKKKKKKNYTCPFFLPKVSNFLSNISSLICLGIIKLD